MILSKKETNSKPEIDLTGPEGNSFILIIYAQKWAKQLGWDFEPIKTDMMSGDYEHLIEVLEEHFGEMVIFYR